MKSLWKKYDTSVIAVLVSVVFILITAFFNYYLAIAEILILGLLVWSKIAYSQNVRQKLLYNVQAVADTLDFEQGKAFEKLKVACAFVEENGSIIWFNESFKNTFCIDETTPVLSLKQLLKKDNLSKIFEGKGFRVKVDSQCFAVYTSLVKLEEENAYLLYLFDETKLRLTEKEYYESRPSIMLSVIDNSDEIYQRFKESDCAAVFSKIEQMIDDWASGYGGLCRKFSNARMMIVVEERGLQKMIADNFSILEKIRNLTYDGKPTELTLSIGVGKEQSLNSSNDSAKQALDMAQSRGGDQVAIKHEAQYKFYGGVSAGFEKKNKVRTRLIAKTIAGIIKDSDNVLVMGHRFSDFDAFGSAAGIYSIARNFGVPANVVVDKKTSLAKPLIERFEDNKYPDMIISPDKAPDKVGENTLVVVVDTHKQSFTECPELVDKAGRVMVIDHHRKSVGFIENTVVFYHMPNASSACEMVTELAEYVDSKPVIDSLVAQALLAGIMLDTRNFVIRSGVRTFEAAAYLKSRSANTVEAKKLFSNDMEIFRRRNNVIDSAERYREFCAISVAEMQTPDIRLVTSQAADEMLNIEGIKASFVLYKNGDEINISARSFGEVNVQLIMETLGGGGHQAMSACQLSSSDMKTARQKLEKAIDKYIDKYMNTDSES
ncbi:MAG: DHH family phosphoesterase [Oscillospiraceae bacterium]|nr:DHH family phosphoesterase [Oscillospiraceae bacterium]